jgi:hypothetical protein
MQFGTCFKLTIFQGTMSLDGVMCLYLTIFLPHVSTSLRKNFPTCSILEENCCIENMESTRLLPNLFIPYILFEKTAHQNSVVIP